MRHRTISLKLASLGFCSVLVMVTLVTPSCGEAPRQTQGDLSEQRTDSLNAPDGGWPADPADLIAQCGFSGYPYRNVTVKYCTDPDERLCGRMKPHGDPTTTCTSEVCVFRDNCGTHQEACCTLSHELEHARQWDRVCSRCLADYDLPANRAKCTECYRSSCDWENGALHAACTWAGGASGACGDQCVFGDLGCIEKRVTSYENKPLSAACAHLGVENYRDIEPKCNEVFGDLCGTCKCPHSAGQPVVDDDCGVLGVAHCASSTCTLSTYGSSNSNNNNNGSGSGSDTSTCSCVSDVCTAECSTMYGGTLGWLVESSCPIGTCPLQGKSCNAHGERRTVACE